MPEPSPRAEPFFFEQKSTLDALQELAGLDSLVIYCGAGVSIDRTGVTWDKLVRQVFNIAKANRRTSRMAETNSIDYLLTFLPDARQAASIVVQSFSGSKESENDFLGSKLKDILYETSGWDGGLILRNLAQLALAAASSGQKITILTTNYDTYIESEFVDRRRELVSRGLPEERAGGLVRRVQSDDGQCEVIVSAGAEAETVELIYLHGRVAKDGSVEGEIILTEHSYGTSRDLTTRMLERAFAGGDSGLLVVGASLTDEPLIAALAMTQEVAQHRFALLTSPPKFDDPLEPFPEDGEARDSTPIDANTVAKALQLRGKHLGVTILQPLSHNQTAQFLEELRMGLTTATVMKDPTFYRKPANRVSYPERLKLWNERWKARPQTGDAEFAFERLRRGLEGAIAVALDGKSPDGEGLRVEVWVRRNPTSADRTLSLWANTSGPIADRSLLRKEPIMKASRNASVRAFLAGRPQRVGLTDLHYEDRSSRWKTFLSVPIFIFVPAEIGDQHDGGNIPAGVVTLMSNRYIHVSDEKIASVFNDSLTIDDLNTIKDDLIGMGREILGLEDVEVV